MHKLWEILVSFSPILKFSSSFQEACKACASGMLRVSSIVHGAKKGSTFVHDQTSKQTGKANILMISLNTSGKNVGCKKAYTEEVQLFLFKNTCDLRAPLDRQCIHLNHAEPKHVF